MGMSEFGPNHPLAVRLWAKRLFVESLRETFIDRFIGRGEKNAVIQMRDELGKGAGDRVTFGLRLQLVGAGTAGDNTLEGNEEALTTYNDSLIIDQLRHAVRSKGKMSEQRVPFSVRQESMDGLKDWWADRLDTWFFNQAAGFTAQGDVRYTGMQAVLAPDAQHIYRPNSKANDESLTTGDEFSLAHIDRMVARAKTFNSAGGGAVPMRPVRYKGGDYYVLFIHPFQAFSLRSNYNAGAWADLQKSKLLANGSEDNPIFQGGSFLGIYNGVVIHESARVPNGISSASGAAVTNVRRAILCGAQAVMMATGRDEDGGPEKMNWVEELFDYKNQLGVAAGMIAGMKKTQFNGLDFGTVVFSTFAPQP